MPGGERLVAAQPVGRGQHIPQAAIAPDRLGDLGEAFAAAHLVAAVGPAHPLTRWIERIIAIRAHLRASDPGGGVPAERAGGAVWGPGVRGDRLVPVGPVRIVVAVVGQLALLDPGEEVVPVLGIGAGARAFLAQQDLPIKRARIADRARAPGSDCPEPAEG